MKFYNREKELQQLQHWSQQAEETSTGHLTMVIGRRRVGKTALLQQAFSTDKSLYLFISRKAEPLLAEEFIEQIKVQLETPIFGQVRQLKEVFQILLQYSEQQPLTLIFDEFQDIQRINPSFFSDMQNLWDQYKNRSKLHLICCGSIYSLMTHLFQNAKQPLFGRADHRINLKPLHPSIIKQLMQEHQHYSAEHLLTWYCISGGIPKYLEWLVQTESTESLWPQLMNEHSLLIEEGKYRLVEEFGQDQETYFSILAAISSGKTSRPEIESLLEHSIGPQLKKLESEFEIIKRQQPILSKPGSRLVKYRLTDPFLSFWFRYIHRHRSTAEIGNFKFIQRLLESDFNNYSGRWLEELFKELLAETGNYSQIGSYWERGNQNEIDIVAINELEKTALIAEVKRNPKKYNQQQLIAKSAKLIQKLQGYRIEYKGYSLEDL